MIPAFLSHPAVWLGLVVLLLAGFAALAALLINNASNRAEAAEQESSRVRTMLAALDDSTQWLLFVGADGLLSAASQSFGATIGHQTDRDMNLVGADPLKILEPVCMDSSALSRLSTCLRAGQAIRLQLRLHNRLTGDVSCWLVTGRAWAPGDTPELRNGYWLLGVDISVEKSQEEELRILAFTDQMTGLANRSYLMKQLQDTHELGDARALFFIHFPRLNTLINSLGRDQAELFMVTVAGRLKESLTPYQTAARLGSSSFGIMEKNGAPQTAFDSAMELGRNLSKPFDMIDHEVQLIPAIGVALAEHQQNADEWLNNAELAARALHVRNKPEVGLYLPEVKEKLARARGLESDLRRAIYFAGEQLYPAYQPIYDIGADKTNRLVGFEMLARWKHPIYGNVPPLEFIPVAEESGLISSLWVQLFAQACRQMREWHQQQPDLFLSVNLSSRQFSLPGLVKTVDTLVEVTGVSPTFIKLEITETDMMEDPEAALEQMLALKARGFRLSIDDFGTGFSSLSYLHKLPISDVKIDRSFVQTMHDNPANMEIVSMIVRLGGKLGHTTTAEGIETAADLEALKNLGCTLGQGFYFAKPLPAADITPLIGRTGTFH